MSQKNPNRLTRISGFFTTSTSFFLPLSVSLLSILYPISFLLSLFNFRNWSVKSDWWRNPIIVAFSLYFLLYFIGLFYSLGPWPDRLKDLQKHLWLLGTIFLMPIFIEKKWRDYAINAFLAAMVLTLILSYAKFFHLFSWRPDLGVSALFNNYIVQSLLLAFASILLIDRYLNAEKKSPLILMLSILMVTNIFFVSEGRSGYAIFSVLFAYLLFQNFGWKGLIPALMALFLIGLLAYIFSNTLHARINQVFSETEHKHYLNYESSMGRRYAEASNAWYLIKKSPIIGYGTGGLGTAYHSLPPELYAHADIKDQLDLDYLNILMKFGFIGLIVVFIFFPTLWYYAKDLEPREKLIARSLVLFFLVGCIADDLMNTIVCSYLLSLFSAISFAPLIRKNVPE